MRKYLLLVLLLLIAVPTGCKTPLTEEEKARVKHSRDLAEDVEAIWRVYDGAKERRFMWEIRGLNRTKQQWRENEQFIANKLQEAIALAKEALATDPRNAWALELLGMLRFEEKAYDKAIEALEEAQDVDSRYHLLYFIRAKIYDIRARQKFKEGDREAGRDLLADAVDDLEEWVEQSPLKTPNLANARAMLRLWGKELGLAPRQPKSTDGTDFATFKGRADLNWKLYTDALTKKKEWRMYGIDPKPREREANERKIQMNLKFLLINAERASVMMPRNWRFLEDLARYHYLAKNYDRAIRAGEDAKAVNPQSRRLYLVRAHSHWEIAQEKILKREYDEAQKLVTGAVKDLSFWLKANQNSGKDLRKERADLRRWKKTLRLLP